MIRFHVEVEGQSEHVETAVAIANALTNMGEFYEVIASKPTPFDPQWTGALATPKRVAELLRVTAVTITVKLRKHLLKRVKGWTYPNEPEVVYLNTRALNRPRTEIVATLIHEWVHSIDNLVPEDFGHGDNSPDGKDDSAPYWIDAQAAAMAAKLFDADGLPTSEAVHDGFYEHVSAQELAAMNVPTAPMVA